MCCWVPETEPRLSAVLLIRPSCMPTSNPAEINQLVYNQLLRKA